jgi:lantibiotic modifying enzyme
MGTSGAGLYTGIAGSGLALLETYRAAGDERYRVGVLECVSLLEESATAVGDGVEWSEVTDIISGSAGVGLFLLRVDQELGSETARELAVAAGHRLVEQAIATDTGLKWQMAASYDRLMPNFSHGTAGVAFFLA